MSESKRSRRYNILKESRRPTNTSPKKYSEQYKSGEIPLNNEIHFPKILLKVKDKDTGISSIITPNNNNTTSTTATTTSSSITNITSANASVPITVLPTRIDSHSRSMSPVLLSNQNKDQVKPTTILLSSMTLTDNNDSTVQQQTVTGSNIVNNINQITPLTLPPQMGKSISLINNSYQINPSAFEHLHEMNNDYFVIGIIGQANVGKSTILNLLTTTYCTSDNVDDSDNDSTDHTIFSLPNDFKEKIFYKKQSIFEIRSDERLYTSEPITIGIDMFITKDRIILLDCEPALCNPDQKDHLQNEIDDIKLIILLLSVCQLLIVVQDDVFNMNFIRLLQTAEMMKQNHNITDKDFIPDYLPNILFVKNHANYNDFLPDALKKLDKIYKLLFKQSRLRIFTEQTIIANGDYDGEPDEHSMDYDKKEKKSRHLKVNFFMFPEVLQNDKSHHINYPDINQLISEFRQHVLISPRNQFHMNNFFPEKNWATLVTNVWESLKSNYFLKKYESFKEKDWGPKNAGIMLYQ